MSLKRKYNERWSKEMVDAFIAVRIQLDDMFTQKRIKPRKCWELVGEQCGANDHWSGLKQRWNNLIKKYKRLKNSPTENGNDGADNPISWPFYDQLHEYYSQRHNINPLLIINSEERSPDPIAPDLASTSGITWQTRSKHSRTSSNRGTSHQAFLDSAMRTEKELRRAARALTLYISLKNTQKKEALKHKFKCKECNAMYATEEELKNHFDVGFHIDEYPSSSLKEVITEKILSENEVPNSIENKSIKMEPNVTDDQTSIEDEVVVEQCIKNEIPEISTEQLLLENEVYTITMLENESIRMRPDHIPFKDGITTQQLIKEETIETSTNQL
ncbi:uncharacterized protein LOC119682250 [Teleopsis dalmanni]|uniref:uncharacterized protein LOC119682250 n=1 Tax=Teleopsis dalmanni TaxID=139649 RepID=UPI0018CF7E53|nr:uncharacterized protein LOC119682250 [Teleopsis dalmanni]